MDDPWAWDAAAWTAAAVWATFAVYVLLLAFASLQVGEARRLREEQARPFVIVDFEPALLSCITIENVGKTVAQHVRIRFDPPLTSTLTRPWPWEETTLLTEGIPWLPPGETPAYDVRSTRESTG